jgi:hypothetical protein
MWTSTRFGGCLSLFSACNEQPIKQYEERLPGCNMVLTNDRNGIAVKRDVPDVLARIAAYKRREIASAKREVPLDAMRRLADGASPARGFAAAIAEHISEARPALIAEIKKASPSKGLIREDFDPPPCARLSRGWRDLPVCPH